MLEVRGLTKHYGAIVALDGLDLTIPSETIYGFIGPNGAGKTTAIRILAGLVRPTAGRIRLEGKDLLADRLAVAGAMRTLVEVPAFYPHLTGRENLSIHAQLSGAPDTDVPRLLEAVALGDAGRRKVGGYSLGMRQRLGIAQALVGAPRFVVLDEPMNGLDPAGMREMRRLIREERDERGTTFLVSSHLLYDVQQLCDAVGILHRGRMVAEGRIDALLSTAVSGYVLETADNARAASALAAAHPSWNARRDDDGALHVDGGEEILPHLHAFLLEQGLPAGGLRPVRPSLERYFLEKTEGVIG